MSNKVLSEIDQSFWSQTICDGHLYLQMGSKLLPLLKPGQFIEKQSLEKYKDSKLMLERVINLEQYVIYKNFFTSLEKMVFEKDQRKLARTILEATFKEWVKDESHLLTFAMAAFDSFNNLSEEELVKLDATDVRLFKKSLYSGALSFISAISNDFYNFELIKDLYRVSFCMDIGLSGSDYTYHVSMAVDNEAQKSGSGRRYLDSCKASQKEKTLFVSHPERGYQLLQNMTNLFSYPELIEIILYQHETSDGKGFPRGITKREVSTWDAICLYADSMVLLSEIEKLETKTLDYLMNRSLSKQDSIPVKKVFSRLKSMINHLVYEERVAS